MTYPLTEVASFLLVNKYGSLTSDVCQQLIKHPDIAHWLEHGLDSKTLNAESMKGGLMDRSFQFISYAADALFSTNQTSILLETRPKLYLGKRETLTKLKELLLEFNDSLVPFAIAGKDPNMTFFESFPDL